MLKSNKKMIAAFFVCVFLFMGLLMWCVPNASDDYEFLSLTIEKPEDLFSYILEYGNGRVLGNLTAITLSRVSWLGVVCKALLVTGLVFLIPAVLKKKEIHWYLLSFVLLIGMSPLLFSEVYTWTAGFSNYIPPIVLTLVNVLLIQIFIATDKKLLKGILPVAVLVLGVASQLFVEHSTVINVLLAAMGFVHCCRKPELRKGAVISGVWLAATLVGAAMMFLVPVIFYVDGNRSEGYRELNLGSIVELVKSCVRNATRLGNSYMGMTGIFACVGAMVTAYMTRQRRKEKWNRLIGWVNLVSLVFQVCVCALSLERWCGNHAVLFHLVCAVFVFLPFITWGWAAFCMEDRLLRSRVLMLLAFAVVSLGVFLIVTPTPARVVFQSYVFVVAAILLCAAEAKQLLGEKPLAMAKKTLGITVCALAVILSVIFLSGREMAQIRQEHIDREMAAGATTIEIFEIPYEHFYWDSAWSFSKYYYHQEPGDVEFVTFDFDVWRKDYMQDVYNEE